MDYVINKSVHALLLFALLTTFGNCFAQNRPGTSGKQQVQFYFDKPITLDSLTRYVHSHSKIRFSFNSTKVKSNKMIYLKKGVYTIDLLLQEIRKNTSLYYSMYKGYVIFQDNPPKQKTTTVPVAPKSKPKPPARQTAIAAHHKPVNKPAGKTNVSGNTKPQPTANAAKDSVKKGNAAPVVIASLPAVITPADSSVTNNRSTAPAKTPDTIAAKPATVNKKENANSASAQNTSAADDGVGTGWQWQFGLQWKGTIPLYGAKNYFTGTNARPEPYNLLIPGIWVSALNNSKHEIMLMVKPAEWYFYNRQSFTVDSGLLPNRPDTVFIRKNTRLIKTGAWYGSLQYNYHISENWMVGAGIGYHLRTGALAYQQTNRVIGDTLMDDAVISMKNDSICDCYLASSFLTGKVEAAYRFGAVDLGLSVMIPLTDPYVNKSIIKDRPLNLQLFVRWRIKRPDDE